VTCLAKRLDESMTQLLQLSLLRWSDGSKVAKRSLRMKAATLPGVLLVVKHCS
jgi:hypothetical protein